MSGVVYSQRGLDRKIDSFMKRHLDEMPDVRDKSVDEMIEDLASDGRKSHF